MRAVALVLALFASMAVAQQVVARSPYNLYEQNVAKERLVRARRSRLAARAGPSSIVDIGIPVLNSDFNIVRAAPYTPADTAQCPLINGISGVLGLTGLTITPTQTTGVVYLTVRRAKAGPSLTSLVFGPSTLRTLF